MFGDYGEDQVCYFFRLHVQNPPNINTMSTTKLRWSGLWNILPTSFTKKKSWYDLCQDEQEEIQEQFLMASWTQTFGLTEEDAARILPTQEEAESMFQEYYK